MSKSFLSSLFLIYAFFFVQLIFSNIPEQYLNIFFIHVLLLYGCVGLLFSKKIFKPENTQLLIFTSLLVLFGVTAMIVKLSFSPLNIFIPIGAFFGYLFFKNTKINLRAFDLFFIVIYSYFYLTYFSLLPDIFFRPEFNEEVYIRASSNVVSQGLNFYLFFYLAVLKGKKIPIPNRLLVYASINLVLIMIQQSRAGLIVGLTLFIIVVLIYIKEQNLKVKKLYFVPLSLLILYAIYKVGVPYFMLMTELETSFSLTQNIRGEAQKTFLNNLTFTSFFFGYPPGYDFLPNSIRSFSYTYNVGLDVWNRYSIFGLITLVVFLFIRIKNYKKYQLPVSFLIPIMIYSSVESLFLPRYWDILLILILFLKKKERIN